MSKYKGDIIEESLANKSVLDGLNVVSTRIEKVTDGHQTPWLSKWNIHTIEVDEDEAKGLAEKLSKALESQRGWYIDYRNEKYHYVVFNGKVFKLERNRKSDYSEMIAYGLSTGTPQEQLPNFEDLPIDVLDGFLREANLHTYADASAERVASLRPSSKDYHFEKSNLVFHDTYFGGAKFIGEEVVYKDGKPVWGMNYFGFTVDDSISEDLFDSILRPALMSGSGDNIPVRGPKEFANGEWRYVFNADGDLSNFSGLEEIFKKGQVVCRLHCHGGFIN